MAIILSIETSTNVCSVALHKEAKLLANQLHQVEKSHSSLLPGIASEVLEEANLSFDDLNAVAVSGGPGSYTGLRIGVTTAKGFCYAKSIPLIAVDTLDIMIESVAGKFKGDHVLCPMMDARRMEVYTKMVDSNGKLIWELQAKILDEHTFETFEQPVYLFGNGMPKFRDICSQDNLLFIDDIHPDASNMGRLANEKFQSAQFEDVAYFEPNYLKEWRTTTPKKKLV